MSKHLVRSESLALSATGSRDIIVELTSTLLSLAPLRGSDRRKLRQRVISEFGVSNEVGDILVPEGIQSQKFSTHLNEPGVSRPNARPRQRQLKTQFTVVI